MRAAPLPVKVWVGKISPSVDDEFFERILSSCGPVKEWKRVTDPLTKASKPFGFCTWVSAQGAVVGLRLLQGVLVDDSNIELKPGKQSEQLIEEWQARGNSVSEADVQNAKTKLEELLESRAQMPQRTKEVLRMEADRAEKRRKMGRDDAVGTSEGGQERERPSSFYAASSSATTSTQQAAAAAVVAAAAALKKKRDDRRRERDRHLQERENMESKGHAEEQIWKEREKSMERSRQKRQKEQQEDQAARLEALGDEQSPGNVLMRRKRVSATKRARDREAREDSDAKASRMTLTSTTSSSSASSSTSSKSVGNTFSDFLLLPNVANATSSSSSTSISTSSSNQFVNLEDEDELERQQQRQKQARNVFVPDGSDTLYRKKLTQAEIQKIVDSIPTDASLLYAQTIDVAFLINIGSFADDGKIREFVSKTISELVGEMPDMVDFIVALLRRGCNPTELEAKMKLVLQEDAQTFVVKLWRFLLFLVKSEQQQRKFD